MWPPKIIKTSSVRLTFVQQLKRSEDVVRLRSCIIQNVQQRRHRATAIIPETDNDVNIIVVNHNDNVEEQIEPNFKLLQK